MSKVFAEYQILPQHRSAYSHWIEEVRANYPELEVYEGADQPGLYVEIWNGLSAEEYRSLKSVRLPSSASDGMAPIVDNRFAKTEWKQLHDWAAGGASKIHIWHFVKVR